MSDAAATGLPATVGAHEKIVRTTTARDMAESVERPDLTWRVGVALLVAAAVILAVAILVGVYLHHLGSGGAFGKDLSVEKWLAAHRGDGLNRATKVGSSLAATETAVAVAAAAFVALRVWLGRFYESWVLVVSLGGELLLFLATAAVVHRDRPTVPRLDAAPPTSSFPSGHTAASVALYGFLAVVVWRYAARRVAVILVLLLVLIPPAVAASRLYRGMHYPSDVLAGALVGGTWLVCVLVILLPRPRGIRADA